MSFVEDMYRGTRFFSSVNRDTIRKIEEDLVEARGYKPFESFVDVFLEEFKENDVLFNSFVDWLIDYKGENRNIYDLVGVFKFGEIGGDNMEIKDKLLSDTIDEISNIIELYLRNWKVSRKDGVVSSDGTGLKSYVYFISSLEKVFTIFYRLLDNGLFYVGISLNEEENYGFECNVEHLEGNLRYLKELNKAVEKRDYDEVRSICANLQGEIGLFLTNFLIFVFGGRFGREFEVNPMLKQYDRVSFKATYYKYFAEFEDKYISVLRKYREESYKNILKKFEEFSFQPFNVTHDIKDLFTHPAVFYNMYNLRDIAFVFADNEENSFSFLLGNKNEDIQVKRFINFIENREYKKAYEILEDKKSSSAENMKETLSILGGFSTKDEYNCFARVSDESYTDLDLYSILDFSKTGGIEGKYNIESYYWLFILYYISNLAIKNGFSYTPFYQRIINYITPVDIDSTTQLQDILIQTDNYPVFVFNYFRDVMWNTGVRDSVIYDILNSNSFYCDSKENFKLYIIAFVVAFFTELYHEARGYRRHLEKILDKKQNTWYRYLIKKKNDPLFNFFLKYFALIIGDIESAYKVMNKCKDIEDEINTLIERAYKCDDVDWHGDDDAAKLVYSNLIYNKGTICSNMYKSYSNYLYKGGK